MQTHRGALRAIERQRAARERGQAAPETSGLARGALGLAATGALALGLAQYRKWKYQERQKVTRDYRAIAPRAKDKSGFTELLSAKQSRLVYKIVESGAVSESEGGAKLDRLDDGGFEWEEGSERAYIRKPESGQAILVGTSGTRFSCTVRSVGAEQDACIAGVPPLCAAMATELLAVKAAWGLAKLGIVVTALSNDGEWLDKEYECSESEEGGIVWKGGECRHRLKQIAGTCVPLRSHLGWFEDLFGFVDGGIIDNANQFTVSRLSIKESRYRFEYDPEKGELTLKKAPKTTWKAGTFELASLEDIRERIANPGGQNKMNKMAVRLVTEDVAILHGNPEFAGAIFQATSEHNCLQLPARPFLAPKAAPENGVASYALDKGQGAACAIACAPGAVVRAYFALKGGKPQTANEQINTLGPLISFLTAKASAPNRPLARVSNGYVDCSNLDELGRIIKGLSEKERETAKGLLRVGWQKDTEVTCTKKRVWSDEPWYKGPGHLVHQVYASPIYVLYDTLKWEPLARLVLEAAYEATLRVAVLVGAEKGTRQTVVLTALGREAGSVTEWVADAVVGALAKFESADLDVVINKGCARGIECDLIMSRIRDAQTHYRADAVPTTSGFGGFPAPVVMYTE